MKKFELTSESTINIFGKKLFRIKALVEFGNVKEGEIGGFVEKEENLSHEGNAWVCGDAEVYGDAKVCGDAEVYGDAKVCGNAEVYGDAKVFGNAWVCGDAKVFGDADYATVKGFGTEYRITTFFKCRDGVTRVRCGCFYGDLEQFRNQVKNTRKGKIAEEYLMIADLMEKHFDK